jgi:hypothetical protein
MEKKRPVFRLSRLRDSVWVTQNFPVTASVFGKVYHTFPPISRRPGHETAVRQQNKTIKKASASEAFFSNGAARADQSSSFFDFSTFPVVASMSYS